MALMYTKGFASFTEKGNNEQKLFLRVRAQVCITNPEARRENQRARISAVMWYPAVQRVEFSGYVLENTILEANDKVPCLSQFYQNSPVNV